MQTVLTASNLIIHGELSDRSGTKALERPPDESLFIAVIKRFENFTPSEIHSLMTLL